MANVTLDRAMQYRLADQAMENLAYIKAVARDSYGRTDPVAIFMAAAAPNAPKQSDPMEALKFAAASAAIGTAIAVAATLAAPVVATAAAAKAAVVVIGGTAVAASACSPMESEAAIIDSSFNYLPDANEGDKFADAIEGAGVDLNSADIEFPPDSAAPETAEDVVADTGSQKPDAVDTVEDEAGSEDTAPADTAPDEATIKDSILDKKLEELVLERKKTIAMPSENENVIECQFESQPVIWAITTLEIGGNEVYGEFPASFFLDESDDEVKTTFMADGLDLYGGIQMASWTDPDDGKVSWQVLGLPVYDEAIFNGNYKSAGDLESIKYYLTGSWVTDNGTKCIVKYAGEIQ